MILHRLENDRFSEVAPTWSGACVVLIGGGPSLTYDQVDQVQEQHSRANLRCIAINDAYLWAPWADVHYAADAQWHRWHSEGIDKPLLGLSAASVRAQWSWFAGQKCSIENGGGQVEDDSVHLLRNAHGAVHGFGLSLNPRALVTGRNSGFQALNLAVLAGAKRVILLGFDGKPAQDGKAHWFGDHPSPTPPAAYPLYRQAMSAAEHDMAAAGVEVVNCSPGSAIDAWPKMELENVL
jgi:hypothetical protein